MAFKVDIRQVIHSFSDALDLVGIDEVYHGKRVAFMAWTCGKAMKLNHNDMDIIYNASLLHDCGVSSTQLHRKLVTELDWSGSQEHCQRGEVLLKKCHPLSNLAPIVRYHHTHWDELPLDLEQDVALKSNLIYLADRVDALIAQHRGRNILSTRKIIIEKLMKYRGTFFNKVIVDTFIDVATSEYFWLMLEPRHLNRLTFEMEKESKPQVVGQKTFLQMATIFAEIVDAKSPFTVEHSLGVSRLARFIGDLVGLSEDKKNMLEVAGLLHDLGKLNVPDEILDKPGALSLEERMIMMRHSFESYQILSRIEGFEDISKWAAFHHEALSGKGYPFHRDKKGLSLEARIVAVADVFQALAQNRPYRDSLPKNEISNIMDDMVARGHLDPQLVDLTKSNSEGCLQYATCVG